MIERREYHYECRECGHLVDTDNYMGGYCIECYSFYRTVLTHGEPFEDAELYD